MSQSHIHQNDILIVDDTPENLTVLRRILTEHGYRVRPVLTGELALKTVQMDKVKAFDVGGTVGRSIDKVSEELSV